MLEEFLAESFLLLGEGGFYILIKLPRKLDLLISCVLTLHCLISLLYRVQNVVELLLQEVGTVLRYCYPVQWVFVSSLLVNLVDLLGICLLSVWDVHILALFYASQIIKGERLGEADPADMLLIVIRSSTFEEPLLHIFEIQATYAWQLDVLLAGVNLPIALWSFQHSGMADRQISNVNMR